MSDNAASPSTLRTRFGPVALVTGASSGIGAQFARELAADGFHLIIVGRDQGRLDALRESINSTHGVTSIVADLAHPQAVRAVIEGCRGHDVGLVVCAAGFGSSGPLVGSELAIELELVHVNCTAVLELCWHFGRAFREKRRGGIVLMGSLVGFQGAPHAGNYAASKAYVQSLAEALHHELKPFGVSVISSAPGPVHSGFAERAGMKMSMAALPHQVARATLNALGRRATIRPGFVSKFLGWSLSTAPRWLRVRMMARIMKGMSSAPKEK